MRISIEQLPSSKCDFLFEVIDSFPEIRLMLSMSLVLSSLFLSVYFCQYWSVLHTLALSLDDVLKLAVAGSSDTSVTCVRVMDSKY